MRIVTQLMLALGALLVVVMSAYGLYTQRHRETLLGEAHVRDTEMMAGLLAQVVSNAARDGRGEDVGPLLERAREHPEVMALALVDSAGSVLAGTLPRDAGCLRPAVEAARSRSAGRGSVECGGRVDWAALPGGAHEGFLLVARRASALEREIAAGRRQVAAVTLILTLAGAGVIALILRRTLSRPLDRMLEAVERLGRPRVDDPVRVPPFPGELGELATAFNDLDRRLAEKKRWIVEEVEERMELEGRLRTAERFAAAGRIVGGLAHELGSPLNVIGVRAEAIAGGDGGDDDARCHAEEIVAEVDRIAALVRSLSHLDREGGIDARTMDVAETVRGVRDDLAGSAGEVGVEVVADVPGEPVEVQGDPALLRLAVRNLAANALHAAEARSGEGTVRLRVVPEADAVRIEVEDDGPGIGPDVLPRVFEPFFTTKDVGEGTGLGLSTALGIAERHGGELRLETAPEQGVRAILTLPRRHDAGAE
ncbi:MAG: sensor histidine kinase, partial [Gemmatimonadota bacterium]